MKVKIESWKDLRIADVWLGMEVVQDKNALGGIVRLSSSPYMNTLVSLYPSDVDGLILAGNDTVERRPEKVVIEATVYPACIPIGLNTTETYHGPILGSHDLAPFLHRRVKVTIEPL